MNRAVIAGIIIAAIAIPVAVYTASPLFTNTVVNEEVPNAPANGGLAPVNEFEEFMAMSEEERMEKAQQMSEEEKNTIMVGAAQTQGTTVNEGMTETVALAQTTISGSFVGVNDGIHNAEGRAIAIALDNGGRILRLEDFRSTNGPDLYVYIATDKSASDFLSLGRLKGNIGNQNYEIPAGADLAKYDTVLIWCQAFSVLFGSAELTEQ